jgi:hypothetical protein
MSTDTQFKMDKRQEQLLRKAVQAWKKAKSWQDKSINSENCVLCKAYVRVHNDEVTCGKCPVYQFTGKQSCRGTPAAHPIKHTSFSTRRKTILNFSKKMFEAAGLKLEKEGDG